MASRKKGYNKKPRRSKAKVPSPKISKGKTKSKGGSFSSKIRKGMGMGKNILGNLTGIREAGKVRKMLGGSR